MTNRRIHSAEFKRDAIQLARTSGNLSGTARDLGIHISLLRKWTNAEQEKGERAFPGQGRRGVDPSFGLGLEKDPSTALTNVAFV